MAIFTSEDSQPPGGRLITMNLSHHPHWDRHILDMDLHSLTMTHLTELRQEIDGPQAEQLGFVPCGQILQVEEEEELSPAQIRDHIFLILEVKETLLTIREQKGSLEVKRE